MLGVKERGQGRAEVEIADSAPHVLDQVPTASMRYNRRDNLNSHEAKTHQPTPDTHINSPTSVMERIKEVGIPALSEIPSPD